MFLVFKPNVYLVKGKVKGCLYDFNSGNLYHLESSIVEILSSTINRDEKEITNTFSLKVIDEFIENNLIEKSKDKNISDICDLKSNSCKIDFAWIEITTKCNLYCIHCYDSASPQKNSVMSMDSFEKVHKFITDCGIKRIQFIGGEPLLYEKALKQMILSIRNDVDFIEVFTNATCINESWADFFAMHKVNIAISVYSYDSYNHDKVTQINGSHIKTNNGIHILANHNVPYRVCNVLMNGVDIGECSTDLYKINPNKDVVRMTGRANFGLLSEELIKKRLITKKTFSAPLNLKISRRLIKGHNCFGHKIYISTKGDVFPCVMERRFSYGNINNNFEDVLSSVQNCTTKITKETIDSCKDCEFRFTCFDCRPNSLGNSLNAKPWYCTYIPEKGEWEDVELFIQKLIKQYSISCK